MKRSTSPSKFAPSGRPLPLLARFLRGKVLLGMVHLPPLPGSPGHRGASLEEIIDSARRDAEAILEGGLDGYLVENFGDAPFFKEHVPPHVLTAMTRIALALPRPAVRGERCLAGVNVLRNDASGALAVAAACALDLIRVNVHAGAMVTDQGLIEGRAAQTLRERKELAAPVAIAADLLVKHAAPLGAGPVEPGSIARDLVERGLADVLIVTGSRTGAPADLVRLRAVRAAAPGTPILAGSGVTPESAGRVLETADGFIVGTALKRGGDVHAPVDRALVRALVGSSR